MKATELMIDDWVLIEEPDKYAGAKAQIKTLIYHKEDDGQYFNVFIRDKLGIVRREVFNEDLRPIPLTAEILEKNDFVYYKEHDIFQLYTKDIYVVEVGIYHPDFINIGYRQRTPDGVQEGIISSICKIDGGDIYVHELQHALRLCEIEKEIEL